MCLVSPSDAWSVCPFGAVFNHVIITDTCKKCKLQIE